MLRRMAKVVVVTGGAQGLGLAQAKRFADGGYTVVVADMNGARAEEAALSLPGDAVGISTDVTDTAEVMALFARVDRDFGRLDVLVNNAGITGPGSVAELPEASFMHLVDVHVGGTFRCCKAAHPLLARGGGAVVNISSTSAFMGMGSRSSYAAAKGAISSMTRDLACEWAPDGIRVNAVAPGPMRTEMFQNMVDAGVLPGDKVAARLPAGRVGEPSEIAEAIAWLLSDAASYVTGTTLRVAGGR
jgi:NAD(P)-dependent dehydrogenase (short-subunit alcohol dehydrogenase family)